VPAIAADQPIKDVPVKEMPYRPPAQAEAAVFLLCLAETRGEDWAAIRDELTRTVAGIDPARRFDIVIASAGGATACFKELSPGTDANKRAAEQFAPKAAPKPVTAALPAVRAALARKPQVIFLLGNAPLPDFDAVKAELVAAKVRVHTIAFAVRDEVCEKQLKEIADRCGGMFKFVSDADVK
jgi:hypothetical protein